uniref:Uncharacterized protein n=1 Tax=Arundo donax TaxID=35708 RepID=A0A0A9B6A6_ARUDO
MMKCQCRTIKKSWFVLFSSFSCRLTCHGGRIRVK